MTEEHDISLVQLIDPQRVIKLISDKCLDIREKGFEPKKIRISKHIYTALIQMDRPYIPVSKNAAPARLFGLEVEIYNEDDFIDYENSSKLRMKEISIISNERKSVLSKEAK